MEMAVAQQAMMILMMSLDLLKKLCVLLCMPQNAPECTSEHLIFLGEYAPRPPKENDCTVALFSTSANNVAPPRWKAFCTAL